MKRTSSILLFSLVSIQSTVGVAAEPPKHHRAVQPPGLYRIDWEGTTEHFAPPKKGAGPVVMESKIDGASGDNVTRIRADGKVQEYAEKGKQPVTHCLQPSNPAMEAAAKKSCPDNTIKVVDAQTLSYVANCPTVQTVRTVKRVDDKTWAIDSVIKMKVSPSIPFKPATVKQRWTRIADLCTSS